MNSALTKPDSTELALDRTWLAHERTLMAWIRTATSMISFGFTIYKFFQFETEKKAGPHGLLTPRDFALIMIGIGLVSLLLATIGHRREMRELGPEMKGGRRSLAEVVAGLVAVFGILVLLAALFRN
jgi:putative membrane protein